ncbi:MAG: hypothetical protein QM714_19470 [Nocardioides sp.]|uniref:hypothetical protein n=1 Tax=Nocardioides sp. TaxID=35761 RepID=UPI0039E21740
MSSSGVVGGGGGGSPYELRGAGSPQGVVAAPVGFYYTDEAGTNGAVRWASFEGIGTTGWRCIAGDTGRRQLDALLVNGWTVDMHIYVRRINDQVEWRFEGINGAARTHNVGGAAEDFLAHINGFRPAIQPSGQGNGFGIPLNTGSLVLLNHHQSGYWRADGPVYNAWDSVRLLTADDWPAALPGVAG